MPDAMAFWSSSTILTANFLAVYDILNYYFLPNLPFNISFAFIVFGTIAFLNYIIIFAKGSYKQERPPVQFGIGVIIYLLFSIGIIFYTASLHHERNTQEKQQQKIWNQR